MSAYSSRYVHKIAPSDKDIGPVVTCEHWPSANPDAFYTTTGGALVVRPGHERRARALDRRHVGAVLRAHRVLIKGSSVREARLESDGRIVAFPNASIWRAIILTPNG